MVDSRSDTAPPGEISTSAVRTWWRGPISIARHGADRLLVLGLGQDPAAQGHHCVSGKGERAGLRHAGGFFARHALRIKPGEFVAMGSFVDPGRDHPVGDYADLRQKREAARAGGGKNERRDAGLCGAYLKRNVIRPLDKS